MGAGCKGGVIPSGKVNLVMEENTRRPDVAQVRGKMPAINFCTTLASSDGAHKSHPSERARTPPKFTQRAVPSLRLHTGVAMEPAGADTWHSHIYLGPRASNNRLRVQKIPESRRKTQCARLTAYCQVLLNEPVVNDLASFRNYAYSIHLRLHPLPECLIGRLSILRLANQG